MSYILSYDIITSGLKASLYHTGGALAASLTLPLTMRFDKNHAQQSAHQWYSCLCQATKTVLEGINPGDVACLSFTDQVQVCLLVDKAGQPLYDAITWSDTRALEVADPLAHLDQGPVMAITGQRNTPASPLRKLCWMREKLPDVYGKAYKMLGCKDYLALRLTGEFVTDYSDASSTGAFDLAAKDWSDEILSACGIPQSLMPQAVAPTQVVGTVSPAAARETGLSTATKVVMGSGDFTCSAVGAGCLSPGQAYFNLGSSSWLAFSAPTPVNGETMSIVNNVHAAEGLYLPLLPVQEAGASFKWLRAVTGLGGEKTAANPYANVYPYKGVAAHLQQSGPGAGGLLFLPFLLGPAALCYEQDLRGGLLGLTANHTEADLTRSVWEGIAHYFALFAEENPLRSHKPILVTGVASQEREMIQVLSDVLGLPLQNTQLDITLDSIGAAIIAGVGAGIYNSLDQADLFYRKGELFSPDPAANSIHRRAHRRYSQCVSFLAGPAATI